VIGTGPVGLGIAKALKQHGIAYQFDADDDLGGNWYHGVYDAAHIISSRKTTEYADDPMPASYPDFPSRAQMVDYLRDFARHFAGSQVTFVDGTSGDYDLIVCATGFHVDFPFLPKGLVPVTGGLAHVYGGALLPDYRHLYIIGTVQPRYGFGPLLTEGAELLARLIKMQDEMALPLGRVLKEQGQKPPATHLVNPGAALREMRRAKWLLPIFLPRAERRLRRKIVRQTPPFASEAPLAWPNADLTVY
jgi:hypothetical protein